MKLSTAVALVGAAQAAQLPTPPGAQIGLLHFPITCAAIGFVNITLDGVFTATAPLEAQAGQKIYYTDVTAQLTIPGIITSAANLVSITSANAFVHVGLVLQNAQPASFPVFPNGLWVNNTKLNAFGDTVVKVPVSGVLPPIGPVTMGTAGQDHIIDLGVVDLQLYLYNSTGGLVYGPLPVNCPIQNPKVQIGLVNVRPATSTASQALAPANGFEPNFPAIGLNQEAGCFNFDYQCKLGIFGPFAFPVVACGGIKTYEKPGAQFYLENVTSTITIPSSVVDASRNLFSGAASIDTTVQSFYIGATNAQPASVNGIKTPPTYHNVLPASGTITLNLPSSGSLRIGPYTAGSTVGQLMYLTIGNSTSHASIKNAAGASVGEVDIVCNPAAATDLIGIIISNTDPQNVTGQLPSGGLSLPSFSLPGLPSATGGFALPSFTGFGFAK